VIALTDEFLNYDLTSAAILADVPLVFVRVRPRQDAPPESPSPGVVKISQYIRQTFELEV
jgi:hypothetical protein